MRISDWVQTCALPILRAFPLSWKRHSIIAPVREYRPMMIRPFLKRAMLRLATAFALLITGYWAAGLIGGAIPAHAGWRPPAQGITIYVETNGVHTDLVLPRPPADRTGTRLNYRH